MKQILIVVLALAIAGGVFWNLNSDTNPESISGTASSTVQEQKIVENNQVAPVSDPVERGVYDVNTEKSTVNWAGKKPLLDGYINKGSLAITEGQVEVADDVKGNFVIDMNTLSVSDTPTKPGKESALEGHLKGEGWFAVEKYPQSSFTITEAVKVAGGSESDYTVRGNLTMKGQTHELVFPATVSMDQDGNLVTKASFEFDRTKWGLTAGSGSFFDNLADNVVDDMVALSFTLVAERRAETE